MQRRPPAGAQLLTSASEVHLVDVTCDTTSVSAPGSLATPVAFRGSSRKLVRRWARKKKNTKRQHGSTWGRDSMAMYWMTDTTFFFFFTRLVWCSLSRWNLPGKKAENVFSLLTNETHCVYAARCNGRWTAGWKQESLLESMQRKQMLSDHLPISFTFWIYSFLFCISSGEMRVRLHSENNVNPVGLRETTARLPVCLHTAPPQARRGMRYSEGIAQSGATTFQVPLRAF